MDLFGRKARQKFEDELAEVNRQLLGILREVIQRQRDFTEVQEKLADTQRNLAVSQEQVRFLRIQRDQLANSGPQFSTTPIHMSEEEEDARFLGEVGLMTAKEVEELLDNTGFENTEIEFQ